MAEGNGIDLGSIYGLLVDVAKKVSQQEAVLERHGAMLEQIVAVVAKQDERLRSLEERMFALEGRMTRLEASMVTKADLDDLRRTVDTYHSSVVAQGILASELEGRVQRVEQHLNLPPFVHG